MSKKKSAWIAVLVVLVILIIDQAVKIWVKTNMYLGESIEVASWFKIHFVENNGMAFGMEVGSKLFLTLFRIVAIGFIGYYISQLVTKNYAVGYIVFVSMIWAGAMGNIIDCVFYGEIFSASYPGHVATFVPIGEGYSSWMHGKVVDMLYFPLINGTFPDWFPVSGGEEFTFFSPVFNIADSAITVGIFVLLLFYRKTLLTSLESNKTV